MERRYITLHMGPNSDAPTIDLIKGSSGRVVVFAERVEPRPPGLPDGLVAIALPANCYIDTAEDPAIAARHAFRSRQGTVNTEALEAACGVRPATDDDLRAALAEALSLADWWARAARVPQHQKERDLARIAELREKFLGGK